MSTDKNLLRFWHRNKITWNKLCKINENIYIITVVICCTRVSKKNNVRCQNRYVLLNSNLVLSNTSIMLNRLNMILKLNVIVNFKYFFVLFMADFGMFFFIKECFFHKHYLHFGPKYYADLWLKQWLRKKRYD